MSPQTTGTIPETNYNTVLPQLVLPRLPGWKMMSQKTRQIKGSARIPDVMMETARGLPIAVECKYDKPTNIAKVEQQTETLLKAKTIGDKQIDIAVAVLYPGALAQAQSQPSEALSEAVLKYAVYYTTSGGGAERFPAEGWLKGDPRRVRRFSGCARRPFNGRRRNGRKVYRSRGGCGVNFGCPVPGCGCGCKARKLRADRSNGRSAHAERIHIPPYSRQTSRYQSALPLSNVRSQDD